MDVFRLEHRGHPDRGPWYENDTQKFYRIIYNDGSPDVPAIRADKVAKRERVKQPSEHPSPARDGIPFVANHDKPDWFFGFGSIEQYHDWFQTPKVRKAVLGDDELVLAKYTMPAKAVKAGGHQVIFKPAEAYSKEICTSKFAIG